MSASWGMARWMARVAPGGGEGFEAFGFGHRAGAAGEAGEDHGLSDGREREFRAEGGGGGGVGGDAGGEGVGDGKAAEAAELLGDGAVEGEIAGMEARDVLPGFVGAAELGFDRVEVERGGVDEAGAWGTMLEHGGGDDGAGVEADGAGGEEVSAAEGDEVGGAGAGTDEVDGHGCAAKAQVAWSLWMRGRMRVPSVWARAAASAMEAWPVARRAASERVGQRGCIAAIRWAAMKCRGRLSWVAAWRRPGSWRLVSGAARAVMVRLACVAAWWTRATMLAAGQSRRQPMPAVVICRRAIG